MESLVKQVYEVQQLDTIKVDFVSLVNADKEDLEINLSDDEIQDLSKHTWKKYVKEKIKYFAHQYLVKENSAKEKMNL